MLSQNNNKFRSRTKNKLLTLLLSCVLLTNCTNNTQQAPSSNYVWRNVEIGGGGFVTGIITCPTEPNLVFARTDIGGAYRWIDSTKSWKPITDFIGANDATILGIESVAIDPQNPNNIYISAGINYLSPATSYILISHDYGDSFQKVDVTKQFTIHANGPGRQCGERLAVDPNCSNIILCGTRFNGLWRSSDSGLSWEREFGFPLHNQNETANNGICCVLFDEQSGKKGSPTPVIYAGLSRIGDNNLYVSKDGGKSWSPVKGARTDMMPHQIKLNDNKLYVTYNDHEGPWNTKQGSINCFDIAKQKWSDVSPQQPFSMGGISISNDGKTLLASSLNQWVFQSKELNIDGDEVYRSNNGGKTWEKLFQSNLANVSNGEISWMDKFSMYWVSDIEIDPFNSKRAWANSGCGIFMTENLDDSISNWVFTPKGMNQSVCLSAVSLPSGELVSCMIDFDGYVHSDLLSYPNKIHTPSIGTNSSVAYAGQKPNIVIRAGGFANNQAVLISNDCAQTWQQIKTESIGRYRGQITINADGSCVVWSPENDNHTYWTTDWGENWNICIGTQNAHFSPVADSYNPSFIYGLSANGILYVSRNAGSSFEQYQTSIAPVYGNVISVNHTKTGEILVPGNNGLFRINVTNKDIDIKAIKSITHCEAVGYGVPAPNRKNATIYIFGTPQNQPTGIYRSIDDGETWVRINNDHSQYGGPGNGHFIIGDKKVFGRVFMSTIGRGIVYGELCD